MNIGVLLGLFTNWAMSTYAYSISDSLDQTIGPVHFVSILYRHGQRAPLFTYSGFEATYPQYWPRGYGELTTQGLQDEFQLGQWLRRRYNNLVPFQGHLSSNIYSLVSSDLNRCVQSAQANLAGMFPVTEDDEWGGPGNWLPLPFSTQPDNIFNLPNKNCPTWAQEYDEVLLSKEYSAAVKKYSNVGSECNSIFNTTWGVTDPLELAAFLWAALPIRDLEALPMTSAERNFFRSLDEPNTVSYNFFMHTASMKRLGGHPLLNWIVDDITNAQTNLSQELTTSDLKRFSIYSVKDNTIMGILASLSITGLPSPLPTAALLFELRQAPNGTSYVTLQYRNSFDLTEPPQPLDLPGCSNPCSFHDFARLTQDLIPSDWDKECENSRGTLTGNS